MMHKLAADVGSVGMGGPMDVEFDEKEELFSAELDELASALVQSARLEPPANKARCLLQ